MVCYVNTLYVDIRGEEKQCDLAGKLERVLKEVKRERERNTKRNCDVLVTVIVSGLKRK